MLSFLLVLAVGGGILGLTFMAILFAEATADEKREYMWKNLIQHKEIEQNSLILKP